MLCRLGTDHPRGCGGTFAQDAESLAKLGPSPRVRGNRAAPLRHRVLLGTIPAGAGEPALNCQRKLISGDHPRGCGGTHYEALDDAIAEGPSPRVRGNRLGLGARVVECGTIPAGAGEPVDLEHTRLAIGDHPRGCGGTAPSLPPSLIGPGPSPRVRGNRLEAFSREGLIGTIPAGAGEPPAHWSRRPSHRDHPRGCGGTFRRDRPTAGRMGPSPRVRGNLFDPIGTNGQAGTIPAGAGEPRRTSPISRSSRDHPRGCGGTDAPKAKKGPKQGPSPRVRGNPMEESRTDLVAGTIPAGAGEPSQTMASFFRYRDHPRGCGGTWAAPTTSSFRMGPSPRVRGNRLKVFAIAGHEGTIPAGAGEPETGCGRPVPGRDHPRGCGGT